MGHGSSVAVGCGIGCGHGLDPTLLWLWCRPVAVAPVPPLSLGTYICVGAALKRQKEKKKVWKVIILLWLKYRVSIEFKIIYEDYNSPDALLREIKPILQINSLINFKEKFDKKETLISFHEKIINKINIFKKKWLNYNSIMLKIINTLQINKRIYNSFNVFKWQKKITEWAESETKDYKIPICLKYFSEKNIEKNINQD